METNIDDWVRAATPDRTTFRQAVHLILHAIAGDNYLRLRMIMKGGMLLGIRYSSSRFTEDIDFSTHNTLPEIDQAEFEAHLREALVVAADELPYPVVCRLQTLKLQPRTGGTFPSFKLQLGYANTQDSNAVKRLERGAAPTTVKIDYSFNEASYELEALSLDGEETIQAYGLTDLLAEKLRSIIQQVVRKRNRRQDVYDIWYLLDTCPPLTHREKQQVLDTFHKKAAGRLEPELLQQDILRRSDIMQASGKEYALLRDEVSQPLPPFEIAYEQVAGFYESLPWQ